MSGVSKHYIKIGLDRRTKDAWDALIRREETQRGRGNLGNEVGERALKDFIARNLVEVKIPGPDEATAKLNEAKPHIERARKKLRQAAIELQDAVRFLYLDAPFLNNEPNPKEQGAPVPFDQTNERLIKALGDAKEFNEPGGGGKVRKRQGDR